MANNHTLRASEGAFGGLSQPEFVGMEDPMASHDPSIGAARVMPEMVAAGFRATGLDDHCRSTRGDEMMCSIYRAMHAAALVELVSEGERQRDARISALKSDNAALCDEIGRLHDLLADRTTQRDAALVRMAEKEAMIDQLKAVIGSQPVVRTVDTKPNPFRDFRHDPRRMGPE